MTAPRVEVGCIWVTIFAIWRTVTVEDELVGRVKHAAVCTPVTNIMYMYICHLQCHQVYNYVTQSKLCYQPNNVAAASNIGYILHRKTEFFLHCLCNVLKQKANKASCKNQTISPNTLSARTVVARRDKAAPAAPAARVSHWESKAVGQARGRVFVKERLDQSLSLSPRYHATSPR